MGRSIIAESRLEPYLTNLFLTENFSYGCIIGQPSRKGKEYVVHFARTPEESFIEIIPNSPSQKQTLVNSIEKINVPMLIDHAISCTRLVPGSFYVLGFFIVTPTSVFDNNLNEINNIIEQFGQCVLEHAAGNLDKFDRGEKLILHYFGKNKFQCRSYDSKSTSVTKGKCVEWSFQEHINWIEIHSIFDVDSVFPLWQEGDKYDLDKSIWQSVDTLTGRLKHSLILFNREPLDETETLEAIIKRKARYHRQQPKLHDEIWNATIYFPYNDILRDDELKVEKYNGNLKFSGFISSKVWVNPTNLVSDIQYFIRTDISRSFGARLRLHQDTVPFDAYSKETQLATLLEVLPRRVFYKIPSSRIEFSEYLFREETAEAAVEQIKNKLDIYVHEDSIILDAESLPDGNRRNMTLAVDEFVLPANVNMERAVYMVAIYLVLGVLIVAIGTHVALNYECYFGEDPLNCHDWSRFSAMFKYMNVSPNADCPPCNRS